MGLIGENARRKMEGMKPTDRVRLYLKLDDLHLHPPEVRRLKEMGCVGLVQTCRIASVEMAVGDVEEVARMPHVVEVWWPS